MIVTFFTRLTTKGMELRRRSVNHMAQAIKTNEAVNVIPHHSLWDIAERWVQARQRERQASGADRRPDVQIVKSLWVRAEQRTQHAHHPADNDLRAHQPRKIALHKFFQEDGPVWDANPVIPDREEPVDIRATWASMDV
jgi:hypothetical protein